MKSSLAAPEATAPSAPDTIYNRGFWLAYTANLLLVCANSLTFRFAEFVASRGGTEELSGQIVRAGLIAAIVVRLGLGQAIDRYGPRRLWLLSSVLFLGGGAAFLVPDEQRIFIWLARISYQVGLAGMFSCSIVHIQDRVPPHRRTEVIGSLGSSGFVGTIIGTQLSDLVFRFAPPGDGRFVAMFGGAVALGLAHTVVIVWMTRDDRHQSPEITPGPFRLLFRYWPGPVVFVSIAMGTSFAVTTVFLTRYATAMNLRGIGLFFLPYSVTAFSCRWLIRDWGTTFGLNKMVLWGLAGLTAGQFLFLVVSSDWLFVLPGIVSGFGHALLFPAVVSLGAGRFPIQYRGSGTTLVLGFTELGTAIAAPMLGMLIDRGNAGGATTGFSWMFLAAGGLAGIVGVFYALSAARRPDRERQLAATYSVRDGEAAALPLAAESDTGEIIALPAVESSRSATSSTSDRTTSCNRGPTET